MLLRWGVLIVNAVLTANPSGVTRASFRLLGSGFEMALARAFGHTGGAAAIR